VRRIESAVRPAGTCGHGFLHGRVKGLLILRSLFVAHGGGLAVPRPQHRLGCALPLQRRKGYALLLGQLDQRHDPVRLLECAAWDARRLEVSLELRGWQRGWQLMLFNGLLNTLPAAANGWAGHWVSHWS